MHILVLGTHRSGTSAVTRLINMMGAYVGPEDLSIGASEENPRGFWERKDVIAANDALLAAMGCSWHDITLWDADTLPDTAQSAFHNDMQTILDEMTPHAPWVMKDPRLCLTFPTLLPLLDTPICVIVHRDPLEIAMSLNTRNNLPIATGLALWESYMVYALNASRDLPCIYISHTDVLEDPIATTRTLHNQLQHHGCESLTFPEDTAINEFISPSLHREKASDHPPYNADLEAYCTGKQRPKKPLTLSQNSYYALQAHHEINQTIAQLEEETGKRQGNLDTVLLSLDLPTGNTSPEAAARKINGMKQHMEDMETTIRTLTKDCETHQQRIHDRENDIQLLTRYLELLAQYLAAIETSKQWRLGEFFVRNLSRLGAKNPQATVFDDVHKTLGHIDEWRSGGA